MAGSGIALRWFEELTKDELGGDDLTARIHERTGVYADLLGGAQFDPAEHDPMIGSRDVTQLVLGIDRDPEFAAFLVEAGIDSMSLAPDGVISVLRRVAAIE